MARPLKLVADKALIGRHPGVDAAGRPLNPGPGFKRVVPVKPGDLSPVASAWWDSVVPHLVAADLTSTVQESALVAAAECWSRWSAANEIIKAEGLLSRNSQGVIRHPATIAVQAEAKEYMAWCRLFGLSPADEQRVGKTGGDGGQAGNPFAGTG